MINLIMAAGSSLIHHAKVVFSAPVACEQRIISLTLMGTVLCPRSTACMCSPPPPPPDVLGPVEILACGLTAEDTARSSLFLNKLLKKFCSSCWVCPVGFGAPPAHLPPPSVRTVPRPVPSRGFIRGWEDPVPWGPQVSTSCRRVGLPTYSIPSSHAASASPSLHLTYSVLLPRLANPFSLLPDKVGCEATRTYTVGTSGRRWEARAMGREVRDCHLCFRADPSAPLG